MRETMIEKVLPNFTLSRRGKPHSSLPHVTAIGNFDGVHIAHKQIIQKVVQKANELNLTASVVTFEPLPQKIVRSQLSLLRLTSFRQKMMLFKKMGIQEVMCLPFNLVLAKLSPTEFIQQYLVDCLRIRYLIVGEDFRFGYQQSGDCTLLKAQGLKHHFEVEPFAITNQHAEKISSTLIRQALAKGNLSKVKALLGRNFSITERVQHGAKRGQLIGFRTANLPLIEREALFKGVFITKVYIGENAHIGVTNVGTRPTVDGRSFLAETHILDFSDNLYGKRITIEFIHLLREEKKFTDINALISQIRQDIAATQDFFKKKKARYKTYEQSGL